MDKMILQRIRERRLKLSAKGMLIAEAIESAAGETVTYQALYYKTSSLPIGETTEIARRELGINLIRRRGLEYQTVYEPELLADDMRPDNIPLPCGLPHKEVATCGHGNVCYHGRTCPASLKHAAKHNNHKRLIGIQYFTNNVHIALRF